MKNPVGFDKKRFMGKLRNKGFLISFFIGFVPLVLRPFGIELPGDYNEIVYALSGILVALGLVSNPEEGDYYEDVTPENEEAPRDYDENL